MDLFPVLCRVVQIDLAQRMDAISVPHGRASACNSKRPLKDKTKPDENPKIGNVWVYVQLILKPMQAKKSAVKNTNIAKLGIFVRL